MTTMTTMMPMKQLQRITQSARATGRCLRSASSARSSVGVIANDTTTFTTRPSFRSSDDARGTKPKNNGIFGGGGGMAMIILSSNHYFSNGIAARRRFGSRHGHGRPPVNENRGGRQPVDEDIPMDPSWYENETEDAMDEVRDANQEYCLFLQLRKKDKHQWGVFTCKSYKKGETLIASKVLDPPSRDANVNYLKNATKKPTARSETSCSHSVQVGWKEHVLMDLPARFLNHSCDPTAGVGNCGRVNAEGGSYDFVALRDIEAKEEIRFDYETTEYEVGAFSECNCGAPNCRGIIKGYKHSKDVILDKYGKENNVAAYLTE